MDARWVQEVVVDGAAAIALRSFRFSLRLDGTGITNDLTATSETLGGIFRNLSTNATLSWTIPSDSDGANRQTEIFEQLTDHYFHGAVLGSKATVTLVPYPNAQETIPHMTIGGGGGDPSSTNPPTYVMPTRDPSITMAGCITGKIDQPAYNNANINTWRQDVPGAKIATAISHPTAASRQARMSIGYSPRKFLGITNPRQASQSKMDTASNPTEGVYAAFQIFPTQAGNKLISDGTSSDLLPAVKYRLIMSVDYKFGFFERRATANNPIPGNVHQGDL